jgi:hypothetical protein
MKRELSIPTIAALLYGAFAALAAATMYGVLSRFAGEAGIDTLILVAAPALMAMLIALVVYRRAGDRIRSISQSLSRGLLVAVLTWAGFSALSAWFWCIPSLYAECLRQTLLVSGALVGGQFLIGCLAAAALTGYAIRTREARGRGKRG